jgi:hypothetical protein
LVSDLAYLHGDAYRRKHGKRIEPRGDEMKTATDVNAVAEKIRTQSLSVFVYFDTNCQYTMNIHALDGRCIPVRGDTLIECLQAGIDQLNQKGG